MKNKNNKWYEHAGPEGDVAVSTRIRLARNLSDYPFPGRMSQSQRQEMTRLVRDTLARSNSALAGSLRYIDMEALSDLEAGALVERHAISPGFSRNRAGRGLLITDDESISIMLGEEDHIRIQVMRPGLSLDEAYDTADKIDTLLCSALNIAFDERLGYLTECPTNLGTGLRASVMLHLPALESRSAIGEIAGTVSKIGLTVRGLYGEGSSSKASLYQLSNQVTLGISEQAALDNLKSITSQIMGQERAIRKNLNQNQIEDTVWRALGILRTARTLTSEEMMILLSRIRLGVFMGILDEVPKDIPTALLIEGQPAMLQTGREPMGPEQRDIFRAEFVRKRLA